MGVLNVTPDSFSDGGLYQSAENAAHRIDELVVDGADIVDIGGESTRPGASAVPAREQLTRVEPAVRHAVARGDVLVSVDTTSAEVAERVLGLGVHIINDVSTLRDPRLAAVVRERRATLILMHCREPMSTMRGFSVYPDDAYGDVVADVLAEWRTARDRAVAVGVDSSDIWLDPGLGFTKNARQSYELLARIDEFQSEGVPIVIGPSRKSFIASVDSAPPESRLGGTIAACLWAVDRGAKVLRVHDVAQVRQALAVRHAIRRGSVEEVGRA
jgi:dihydropteroate synthase